MKVSIVIPNWNGEEKLKKNLPDVLKIRDVSEVIVVDDGSTDGSVKLLESEFPAVKLIKKNKNTGFSSTINRGVKEAKGDFVFLVNSDAIPNKDCLKYVLPHFENPRVFSIGCNTGGTWAWAKFKDGFFWHGQALASQGRTLGAHQTLWASGGSGVFKKLIWESLGGLDELFDPFYEEDVDLGYRATKRGFINLFEPKARVEHYKEPGVIAENFSKSEVAKIAQRNALFFIWKNITSKNLMRQHKLGLLKKLITSPGYLLIFLSALKHLEQVKASRKAEEKEEVLSDEEILGKFSVD